MRFRNRIIAAWLLIIAAAGFASCKPNNNGGGGSTGGVVPVEQAREWDGVRRGEVFYEIFVRSFADANGDGVGDLRGIKDKLEYLEQMGVTGLWLTPINPSPSYHGYDVTDYTAVNPDFGTMADFEALVAAAKARGIKIVLDFVVNHSSNHHPWFTDPATQNYYTIKPTAQVESLCTTGALSMVDDNKYVASAWHKLPDGRSYIGAFSGSMPDFDYGRVPNLTPVYDKIVSAARFWLDKGAAGLRLDAVKHIYQNERGEQNIAFLSQFRDDILATHPTAYIVGEVLSGMDDTAPFFKALPALFHFDSWWKLEYALTSGIGKWYPKDMAEAAAKFAAANPQYIAATKLSNHDEVRAAEALGKVPQRSFLAAAALMTMPGQPYIYYGEELGMLGTKDYGDQGVRDPMVWGDGYTPTWRQTYFPPPTIAQQTVDAASLLNFYRTMVRLRNTYPSLASGALTFPDPASVPEPVMIFTRSSASEKITVVMNCSSRETSYISSLLEGKPILSYNGAAIVRLGDRITASLPAYSLLIIESK